MSTYFATFPLTVPFPLFSEALQTSVYWEPSLSVSVSVLNATSPAIAELRVNSESLDEALRAEYEAMRDFFVETLEKFQGTDPEIDEYIARIYTTFLEQTVDTDVYGEPVEWSVNSFTSFSPRYLLDEVEWFQHLPESKREEFITNSSHFNRGSSNYFYGLASAYNAVLRRVISKRSSDWDLWREVPKLQEMYASIELLRDQMQDRNSLRGENSEEIRRLEEAMRVELSQALLDLVTSRFNFDLTWEAYSPTGRYSNHMAYIETKITNPALADEIASQVELEVDNNNLNILTSLQDDFPEYEIPLEVPTRAYNQTGMVSNLNMSRNGRSSDYPVRDAITGRYLWVGGDEYYTGIRRYSVGNGPAVNSMEQFLQYIFPDTRLVSEHDDEYSLAGRGDEFDDYVDEWNRYHALASGQGELQEGDELFVVDGEFDLEAAINGLNDYYSYYGSVEAVMELQFTGTGLYTMPLEELYEAVNRYDDAMEEYGGATPFTVAFESETFKTQQSESYRMDKRNCGCGRDPCVTYGAEPKMRRRVRTISGKPHTPRKLVKDQAITPEEAAKRVKLEAEGQDMYYTREEAMARARELGCHDVHTHEMEGRTVYMPCYNHDRYQSMRYNEMTSSRHIYGAEDKKDDTVISTREESGITTETRQYKKKKYNPEKMKQDIPAEVLDQTDSDDLWVALAFGILGAGIAATVTNMAWMKRVRGD